MSYQFKHISFTDAERLAIEQDHLETLAAEAEIAGIILLKGSKSYGIWIHSELS